MTEYTMPGWKANLSGFFWIIPLAVLFGVPFVWIWHCEAGWANAWSSVLEKNRTLITKAVDAKWWVAASLWVGVVLHELIHGAGMAVGAAGGWKSVSFGFNAKALAPYAHCREPMTPAAYRISLIMPALLLGAIPATCGCCTGNIAALLYGLLFIWTAAGDLMICLMSRKIKTGLLQDHPRKIGFIHLDE
ncbi:MAG: DUF3267 domain-containing protein [Bacteroidales bacterium]|jgi:hypothetical protein|nr:DUF3267 domain-containing protein [Bacteroidales bacterium]